MRPPSPSSLEHVPAVARARRRWQAFVVASLTGALSAITLQSSVAAAAVPAGCRLVVTPDRAPRGEIVHWSVEGCTPPGPTYLRLEFGSNGWATNDTSGIYVPFPRGGPGDPSTLTAKAFACNAEGCSAEAPEMTVQVTRVEPPTPVDATVAVDDVAQTTSGTGVDIDVLANDSASNATLVPDSFRIEIGGAQVQALDQGENHWEWLASSNRLRFAPGATFVGQTEITYSVANSTGRRASASVRVRVEAPPPPVASTLSLGQVVGAHPVSAPAPAVGAMDLDPTTPVIETEVSTPEGRWAVASGRLTFQARLGFVGQASLVYRLTDALGQMSSPALAQVTVTRPPPPLARDDRLNVTLNTSGSVDLLANDQAGDVLSPTFLSGVVGLHAGANSRPEGVLELTGSRLTFTPTRNFFGTVQFSYTVVDAYGQFSAPANVVFEVVAPAPVVPAAFVFRTSVDRGGAWPLDWTAALSGQSVDLNAAVAGVQSQLLTPLGGVTIASGVLTLAPTPKAYGEVTLRSEWTDFLGRRAEVPIRIVVANENAPLATSDNVTAQAGAAVMVRVLANDFPATATGALRRDSITITGGDQRFTASVDGSVTFSGATAGVYRAYYTVKDTNGVESNTATVTISVGDTSTTGIASTQPGVSPSGPSRAAAVDVVAVPVGGVFGWWLLTMLVGVLGGLGKGGRKVYNALKASGTLRHGHRILMASEQAMMYVRMGRAILTKCATRCWALLIAISVLPITDSHAQAMTQWTPYTTDFYCSLQQGGDNLCSLVAFGVRPSAVTCPVDAAGYYRILKGRNFGEGQPLMTAPVSLPCTCIPPSYLQCTAPDLVRLAPGITAVIDTTRSSTTLNIYGPTPGPLFDLDGDGALTAEKEGLMVLRYLMGFKQPAVTAGISFVNGRSAVAAYDQLRLGTWMGWFQFVNPTQYPVPTRDGLLFQRCLAGLRGTALVQGIAGADATVATSRCLQLVAIE